MSYGRRTNHDPDLPIPGRSLGYMGAFRRPSVQTIEKYNKETQGAIPLIKCLGAGFGVFAALSGLTLFMYNIPAEWMVGVKDVAWLIGWLGMFCAGISVLVALLTHKRWTFAVFLPGIALYFIMEYFGNLSYEWWGNYFWTVIAANACLGTMFFGVAYAFWNLKETIQPFELTGFDRVLYKIMKPFLPEAIRQDLGLGSSNEELIQLRAENEELLAIIDDKESMPLIRTDTYAGRLARAEYEWRLGVTQFLFIGATKGFARSAWLDTKLPCGLVMTDGLWRYLCSADAGELHKAGRDVFKKSGRKTVLNDYEPEEILAMAQDAPMPESLKPK
jgi:hypothetical protein